MACTSPYCRRLALQVGAAAALTACIIATPAWGINVHSTAANTVVILGEPYGNLEFDNPLTGTETVAGCDMIEWRAGSAGGRVEAVDPVSMTVRTAFGDEHGDVINFIPPQRAGAIARSAGLTDGTGWCPVD